MNTLKIGSTVIHGIESLQDASEVYRRAAHEHIANAMAEQWGHLS